MSENSSSNELNELGLSASDFISTRWGVEFENLTSRTKVPYTEAISILELGDHELVFDLPEKSCMPSHSVLVTVQQIEPVVSKPGLFKFTGKVSKVEELGEGRLSVSVEFVQYEEASWVQFLKYFNERQSQITEFLKAAKGF